MLYRRNTKYVFEILSVSLDFSPALRVRTLYFNATVFDYYAPTFGVCCKL